MGKYSMEIVELLREQLRVHEQNLAKLELQAARHGMDVPLPLQNQIDFETQKIEELRSRLSEAEAGLDVGEDALGLVAEKPLPLWRKVPMWAWVGIVVVVLLAVAALVFWDDIWPGPEQTPTAIAKVETPAVTEAPTLPASSPTATPVPPTSTPTPLPLTYDENFNDPAFDGTYNTGLWSQAEGAKGSTSTVEQRDGVLVVSQTSGLWGSNAGLTTRKHSNWLLSDLGYVEARLMLDGNFDGEFAASYVSVDSNDTDLELACFVEMCTTGQFCTHEWDRPLMGCVSPDQYYPDLIEVEYNTWHTARIEVDPETVTFHFYFDGYYFDSFTPPNAAALKDDSFRVEVGVYLEPNSSATGYMDDVRIGK